MKSASISDVKKELQELPAKQLADLCLQLAKYKKDNKEFLSFLLFESHDKPAFVAALKKEMDEMFEELKIQTNLYYIKKGLRRILRITNKYCKYVGDKGYAAEVNIYFCRLLKESGIPFRKNKLIVNMYESQLKKINKLVESLHEDLQSDYSAAISDIII